MLAIHSNKYINIPTDVKRKREISNIFNLICVVFGPKLHEKKTAFWLCSKCIMIYLLLACVAFFEVLWLIFIWNIIHVWIPLFSLLLWFHHLRTHTHILCFATRPMNYSSFTMKLRKSIYVLVWHKMRTEMKWIYLLPKFGC